VLTYGSPIWFNDQRKLTVTLQRVQDYAVCRIMGAFCTMPAEPLHQLCAILPMKLRLQMLSKSAVFSLLSIPHSSQLIQWLGPPWCEPNELQEGFPNLPYPTPRTPLIQLAKLVLPESRKPTNFKHAPWSNKLTTPCHFHMDMGIPKGEDCKDQVSEIIEESEDRCPDVLLLFCHRACLSNADGNPIAMAACSASYRVRQWKH
jgi:hypothetical protein